MRPISLPLNSEAFGHILRELALVARTTRGVSGGRATSAALEEASTVGNVVCPRASVGAAIHVDEAAETAGDIISPLAFVESSVWPALHTTAVTLGSKPLPYVAHVEGVSLLKAEGRAGQVWLRLSLEIIRR